MYQMLLRLSSIPVTMMTVLGTHMSFKLPCHIHFGGMLLHTRSYKIWGFLVPSWHVYINGQVGEPCQCCLCKSLLDSSARYNCAKIKYLAKLFWYASFLKLFLTLLTYCICIYSPLYIYIHVYSPWRFRDLQGKRRFAVYMFILL